jgi:hypothetical protein
MRKEILIWLFAMALATASNTAAQIAAVPLALTQFTLFRGFQCQSEHSGGASRGCVDERRVRCIWNLLEGAKLWPGAPWRCQLDWLRFRI